MDDDMPTRPERDYDREDEAKAVDRPATPIENATMELEREQGMLFESVTVLAGKLERVMKRPYRIEQEALASVADAPSKDTERHSPLVRQLSSCTNRSRSTREIIEFLTKNLEV